MCVEVGKKKGDSVVVGRSLVIVVIIIRVTTFIFVVLSLSLSPFFLLSSHIMCLKKRSFVFFEFRFSMFSKKREREQ